MQLSVFQIVILSIFGALAVAGVSIFAFVVSTSQTTSLGDVEVWGTFDAAAVDAVLRQLAEQDRQFKNITYVKKNSATYASELTNALASGRGPDVFIMRQDEVIRDGEKVEIDPDESLSPLVFKNTFIEAADPFLTAKGVVAVPFLADPLILYWNKDMLGTAGFSQPPRSWSELYAMAAKVTKRDDTNSIIQSTIALGEYQNITHAKDVLSLLILQAGGEITHYDGKTLTPSLAGRGGSTEGGTASALQFYTEFANPLNTFYSWNRAQRESRSAFTGGTLALYLGPASEEPLLRQTNPNLNFAAAPVPQVQNAKVSTNVATVYALAIPRTSDNKAGARTAVYLLASSESSRLLSVSLGIPSARRDVLAISGNGIDDLFNKQAIISKSWVDPDPVETDVLFRVMIENIASGALKLSESMQRTNESMRAILRK